MSEERLKVLSFTTVYPRPEDPRFGVFVRARLAGEVATVCEASVHAG